MKSVLLSGVAATAVLFSTGIAYATCDDIPAGDVRILSNDHSAVRIVVDRIAECERDGLTVSANLNNEHAEIQGPALSVFPAEYSAVVIANGSLSSLLTADLVRPLDDLVAEYGQQLSPNQLIKIDGKVMAVAFMANAQHFFYRGDILEEAGLDVPETYEEVLAAADTIREQGIMEYPLAGTLIPTWSIAQEFVNMYLGTGGTFFEPGSAEVDLDMDKAVYALNMIKDLSEYMNPDYLTFNTESIVPMWEAGEVAMANLWGSQAPSFLPENSPSPEIAAQTRLAAAPSVNGNGVPATTVWWDGFAIAKNITDEQAEAAFRAMMYGLSPEMATENPEAAVWLIDGYEPTPISVGILESVQGGAPGYSMLPFMGLLHESFGANLAAFMTDQVSAEEVIEYSVRDYNSAAEQAGYIN